MANAARGNNWQVLPTSFSSTAAPEIWSWRRDLNPRPPDYKSGALPAELSRLQQRWFIGHSQERFQRLFLTRRTVSPPGGGGGGASTAPN